MKFKRWLESQSLPLPIADLIISRRSLFAAFQNISHGRISKTSGEIEVWRTDEGKYQLTDGYHRIFIALLSGAKSVPTKIIGSGYSDYYAIAKPDDRFEYQPHAQYQGLENLADEEILNDLKKRLLPH